MDQDYSPADFNRRGRDIFNTNRHQSCPWCGFDIEQADDLMDEGKRENNHTALLQVIEDVGEGGFVFLAFQWECLRCHKDGKFKVMGPRTDDDMVRKQLTAMTIKFDAEGGES